MQQVVVVTDSTCDLSADLRKQLGIEMVSTTLHFGDTRFRDHIDITPEEFYRKLPTAAKHPTTAAPPPGEFFEVFKRLHAAGKAICCIDLSSKLSATYQAAETAKQMLPEAQVEIVDSLSVSLGLGLTVLQAARAARDGATLGEVAALARSLAAKTSIVFGVDTLEFLIKGGRVGRLQGFVGGLLGIRPLLAVEEGVVKPLDKVRGKAKVLPRVLEYLAEKVPPGRKVRAGVLHAMVPDEAAAWSGALQQAYKVEETVTSLIGAVLGAHAGPGCLGAVVQEL